MERQRQRPAANRGLSDAARAVRRPSDGDHGTGAGQGDVSHGRPAPRRRRLSMGHLRFIVLRHDDQLRRPRRPGRARTRPADRRSAGPTRSTATSTRRSRCAYALGFLLVGRFIDRVGTRIGYAGGAGRLVAGRRGARAGALGVRVRGRPVLTRAGRGGELPRGHQDHRRMVPAPRAGAGDGDLQRRLEHRRRARPAGRADAGPDGAGRRRSSSRGCSGSSGSRFWLPLYDRPEQVSRVSPEELAWIQSDPPEPATPIPWLQLLPHRQTWAFAAGKFLTDPIWWFYLFWSAKFFADRFGADLKQIGPPLIDDLPDGRRRLGRRGLAVVVADRAGLDAQRARKTALLACALCVVPVAFAPVVADMWTAVFLIGLAAAAHQGFSANMYTLASDMFPRRAVGSVIGIAGMAGAVGGILMQAASGRIKDLTGSYLTMFVIAGSVYVLSVLVIHGLVPRLSPAVLEARRVKLPTQARIGHCESDE